ncbi:MAG TPA: ISLre2 family transposase [Massilibacterium sp.]|nr:ISLre2 family transposase [Massilibacterium sp.]
MKKDTMNLPTLKEIELDLFHLLQKRFGEVLTRFLSEIDDEIASKRDKKRFYLHDKRESTLETMFGSISFKRNYYEDREKKEYVFLLDHYLEFDGAKGASPLVENLAMEFAVTGSSYRKASSTLERFLGYNVMSHETIRKHLLETEVSFKKEMKSNSRVLFVEVDGLYIKRQKEHRKGKEEKIAAVHEGWEKNGKRTSLINKRHYIHQGEKSFWEEFEQFLLENYNYDPMYHILIINGDGAEWIASCREYFKNKKNAFFTIDRFHVARDVKRIFREHPRYRIIQKKLKRYDSDGFLLELNSAVGTLEDPKKEEHLEALINQLSKYPEALCDYRTWLQEKGIETEGMRPMGSAEATMSVFASRVKNGRAWVEQGIQAFLNFMVGLKDELPITTLFGAMGEKHEPLDHPKPKFYKEKLTNAIGEATAGNIPYLNSSSGKPVYDALKALQGF